jgi:sortase A
MRTHLAYLGAALPGARHPARPERRAAWLAGSEIGLWLVGAALLVWCLYGFVDACRYQARQTRALDAAIEWRAPAASAPARAAVPPPPAAVDLDPLLFGRVEIPLLGVSTVVREGTDAETLRRAVGHIPGTARPGERGNVGLAGHRDTFFRPLREIRVGDEVGVVTPRGRFEYRVVSMRVVAPADTRVLASDGTGALTLVTCWPFGYVGNAPYRYVVRAAAAEARTP